MAIGIMILAACPCATSSNIISHLAGANLASSESLTAITSLVCVFTTPLIIQFAVNQFDTDPRGTNTQRKRSVANPFSDDWS